MMRYVKFSMVAMCLSFMTAPTFAQAPPAGSAPAAPPNPNAILADLSKAAQVTAMARKCEWEDPKYVLASESILAMKAADLKAMLAPDVRGQVDMALSQAAGSVTALACKQPDGKDLPQQHDIKMFVRDQYWRMIAHVDVLGSLRWGEVFRYTPEERAALDREIAHIREFKGYGYWEVGNPLETLADTTVTLACRERPSNGKPCRPVPPELEGNAATVKTMIETTEAFGKAVAAEKIQEKQDFLAAVGDVTRFSVIGDAKCEMLGLSLNTGDALVKSKVTDGSFGSMTHEVMFAEKFRLGMPDRTGWILLFRSMMYETDDDPYIVLAEDGGEWDEESARNGAGQVNQLSNAIMDDIESRNMDPVLKAKAIAQSKETVIETFFNNLVSMGLMKSINGAGGLKLKQCTAD
tara:strand:- start:28805 stop:30028 length:1224 start_codon:yes stop_codon:yes gene_type:complete